MICYLIAISGGIGSGKSVVSRILSTIGYPVYDCDSRAKILMDTSVEIKREISENISESAVKNGNIDRVVLGNIVFNDTNALSILNKIVHDYVKCDLLQWYKHFNGICFVETAILYQSHLDDVVNEVWEINAPTDIRVKRVMERNNMTQQQVESRIASQQFTPEKYHSNTHSVINDNEHALLPQIEYLISQLS